MSVVLISVLGSGTNDASRGMAIFDDVLLVGADDGREFRVSLFDGDDS